MPDTDDEEEDEADGLTSGGGPAGGGGGGPETALGGGATTPRHRLTLAASFGSKVVSRFTTVAANCLVSLIPASSVWRPPSCAGIG